MNKIYRTIWNESIRAWVAVHENAAACGKSPRSSRRRLSRGLLALGMAATGLAATTPAAFAQVTTSGSDQGFGIGSTSRGNANCVAIGAKGASNAVANCGGADALAVGNGATATGATSAAFGYSARAINNGDLAMGATAYASGGAGNLSAVALGRGATAVGEDALALGNSANAQVNYGAALGNFAQVTARNALAVGNSSNAGGVAATAIGNFATATGANAVAIGGGGVPGAFIGAQATGTGAVAIGGDLVRAAAASATDGIALGGEASVAAGANSGIAIGRGATVAAAATYGIAQGDGAAANQANDIAIGLNAATNANSAGNNIAVGNGVTTGANGQNVAMGADGTMANAGSASGGAVAIGRGQKAIGDGAVALGDPNTANGTGAVALGANNVAAGDAGGNSAAAGAVAIGSGNQAVGQGAVALGNVSSAAAAGALALGDTAQSTAQNAIAFGSNAKASHAGSVALGANAVADGSTLGNAGYNPGSGTIAGTSPVGEVSVGSAGAERRMTNVAAGSGDTDAVNVSQLRSLGTNVNNLGNTTAAAIGGGASYDPATGNVSAPTFNIAGGQQTSVGDAINALNQGWSVTTSGNASGTAVTAIKPGATMTVDGGKNIALTQNGSTISIATSDTPTFTSVGIDNGGPVLSGSGLDMAGHKVTNVAPGDVSSTSTDAVNGSQLNQTNQTVNNLGDSTASVIGGGASYDPATGKVMGPTYNIAGGQQTTISDAINALNEGWNVTTSGNASGTAVTAIKPGATMTVDGGKNIALTQNGSTISIATSDTPTFTSVGIDNGGPVLSGSGLDMAGQKITNVAPGDVSSTSTDAVNGSQLNETNQKIHETADRAVKYDGNPGDPKTQITLEGPASTDGGKTGGTKITNVAQGDVSANSTDAVNGSQLNETNQNVTKLGDTVTNIAGDTSQAYTDQNGMGIRYARTNEAGLAQTDAFAQAPGSTAVGYSATASAADALALGREATASHAGSVALGAHAIADGSTLGNAAYNPGSGAIAGTNPVGEVSVGSSGAERRITNVAAGSGDTDAVNVSQLKALQSSVGDVSDRAVKYDGNPGDPKTQITLEGPASTDGGKTGGTKITNVAQGDVSATSTDAVNGSQLNETNQNVTKLGDTVTSIAGDTSQSYTDQNGMGIRYARTNEAGLAQTDAFAQAPGSTAVGYSATASAADALALGREATASHAGSVALGAHAVADGSTLGDAAYNPGSGTVGGTSPVGEVSVGSSGAERRLTNVAAGSGDTDAVNVSQLKSVEASVSDLDAGAVKYDRNPDGTIDYTHVTMNPGGAPTTITNVAAGELSATSTDAVNGSQLYETNQNVTRLGDQIDNIANGGGIKYFHANGGSATPLPDSQANGAGSTAMGPAAVANGANTVAVGNGSVASKDGDVALGAGSVADRGAEQYTGKYSGADNATAGTVSVGAPGAERTISNVADGREATDAVNVRQLDGAVKAANDYTDQQVQKVAGDVVHVGDQIDKLGDRVTNVEGDVNNIKKGAGGMFQVSQDQTPVAPSASGSNSVAGGAGAVASGSNSTTIGNQASATGSHSTAIGNGAKASGSNSVALGAGSDGSRDNAVSVGAAGQERQIVNVAPGTAGTDAVNVNQLRDMERGLGGQIAGVRNDLQSMDHRLSAGVAAAMAMAGLPQAYLPGRSMVALGGGTWRGESGVALGLSTISDNGKWVVKGSASSTSRGDVGGSVGVGYQW
ncbi:YadA-like family protein [Burkholderia lata]|uniref:YadA-like family protein n=1 Tax=Burkholderia lata (strain ATCC 17760 / DSM 23089 / LMG 22485 / NCIMB 9086 / R18194 / 383) TaxID=482957 RepID=UPI0014539674|nr:YadA-like family protein [Burkholderia lata]VWM04086.1 transporter [Burkholderia lata]